MVLGLGCRCAVVAVMVIVMVVMSPCSWNLVDVVVVVVGVVAVVPIVVVVLAHRGWSSTLPLASSSELHFQHQQDFQVASTSTSTSTTTTTTTSNNEVYGSAQGSPPAAGPRLRKDRPSARLKGAAVQFDNRSSLLFVSSSSSPVLFLAYRYVHKAFEVIASNSCLLLHYI